MRRNFEPFDKMIDQERRLNSSNNARTVCATGPAWRIKLPISVVKAKRGGGAVIYTSIKR
jgi:hypothetical protein